MVGAGAGTGIDNTSTGCSCSIRFVSCIAFPPEKEIGRASRRLSLPLSRVGYAASGGSAPDISKRRFSLIGRSYFVMRRALIRW